MKIILIKRNNKGIANIYRPTLLSRFKSCIPQSLREYLKNIYRWILKQ